MGYFLSRSPKKETRLEGETMLDKELIQLTATDHLTYGNCAEHIFVTGATGSGKSSGSGRILARNYLRAGMGGLVLCAKPEEALTWLKYAEEANRVDDLILFGADHANYFNFLDYERTRTSKGRGETQNIVNILNVAIKGTQTQGNNRTDPFFERAGEQLMANMIDLCKLADEPVTLKNMIRMVHTAPKNPSEIDLKMNLEDFKQKKSGIYIYDLIIRAGDNLQNSSPDIISMNDFKNVYDYFLVEFPNIADKTRSGIVGTFTGMASSLIRGQFYKLFNLETNFTPEDAFKGKIIVLNIPVKQWGEVGRNIQKIFKYMFQQAVERRSIQNDTLPVFLWADEAHLFLHEYDQEFLTTARSARACTVYLTQNISNFLSVLGHNAQPIVDSLLGNFQTKIFHQNSDPVTNEWASRLIGGHFVNKANMSIHYNSYNTKETSQNHSVSSEYDQQVKPYEFTILKKGGEHNNREVESIIYGGGRIWNKSGKNYCYVTFKQPKINKDERSAIKALPVL